MYLVISIVLSSILGGILLVFSGPLIGSVLAFGIITGCLFRGIYLLNEIHKAAVQISPKKDKVQEIMDNYIAEREEKERRM